MAAHRQAYQDWLEQSTARQDAVLPGPWYTTKPLRAKSLSQVFFPEKGVDLQAGADTGQRLWTQRPNWADGRTHSLPGDSPVTTYLYRILKTNRASDVPVVIGSDDGVTVWLNGKPVHHNDVRRGVSPSDRLTLPLRGGGNALMMKIHNSGGAHGFYFRIAATDPLVEEAERSLDQLRADFPDECRLLESALPREALQSWLRSNDPSAVETAWFGHLEQELSGFANPLRTAISTLGKGESTELSTRRLELVLEAARLRAQVTARIGGLQRRLNDIGEAGAELRQRYDRLMAEGAGLDNDAWKNLRADVDRMLAILHTVREIKSERGAPALRRAIEDLAATFPREYVGAPQFLERLGRCEKQLASLEEDEISRDPAVSAALEDFARLRRDALLANPLVDFDRLLLVRRKANRLGLPQNWQGNCAIRKTGYDNQIAVLSPVSPEGEITALFQPDGSEFVGDVDLHFGAERMLFSMPGSHGRWQVWELGADGEELRQVTPGESVDVDNYDACYLPDGRIVFGSTRCFHGVPCVGGGNTVANLCLMNADGSEIRQLCFDQDHNWCPTVLNDGRVLYSRWEYADTPHYFTRLLFRMNPDGTGQMEYYGSNSYWPNSIFYARPIPGHPTKVVAIISGHHGVPRMGELLVFDPAAGRHEDDGAIQRIPGFGKPVSAVTRDRLVDGSWPRFLHPYPLGSAGRPQASGKYFLVSCQPDPRSPWGLYLVDVFDNMLLLAQEPGYALLEPVPLRPTPVPPMIPDKVRLDRDWATVYMTDIYAGEGLAGVPRGAVKKLRVFEYHYAYPRMGGHIHIGIDGSWDVHRIHGTVPVHEDGSALFKVPANTPLAVQPLDEKGRAVQLMRSWFTAMPGETLSCVGCHEDQNAIPAPRSTLAARRPPAEIDPWRGPVRGLSFKRDVQPVLDAHCVSCHNGKPGKGESAMPNLADTGRGWRGFTNSYIALHPYVRRPGPEADYHLQTPLEFHASTSELIQMLEKGHHGVKLDPEAWDRLYTWIDMNVPDHGTWSEHRQIAGEFHARRLEARTRFAGRPEDPEAIVKPHPYTPPPSVATERPDHDRGRGTDPEPWSFSPQEAAERVASVGQDPVFEVDLGDGVMMDLVLIPAGRFIMGDKGGFADEQPPSVVTLEDAFYMSRFEITNQQYSRFDPDHDSGYISVFNKDQSSRGIPADRPNQPVIRVSWLRAQAFCDWLSEKTGRRFSLPTEEQWEWACRAGTATPLNYGEIDTDFSRLANLADKHINRLPRRDSPKWIPCIAGVDDGAAVSCPGGRYAANAWGLYDMHGNVAEWTRSVYRPDPVDGPDKDLGAGRRVVRGGSFYDRPHRARSAFRLGYPLWQRVFNVGIRVVCDIKQPEVAARNQ